MKKQVMIKPRGKDFVEFIKEELSFVKNKSVWIYIDRMTVNQLCDIHGLPFISSRDYRLHIPYGNIVVDGYKEGDGWCRIISINSDTLNFNSVKDPEEILFISSSI